MKTFKNQVGNQIITIYEFDITSEKQPPFGTLCELSNKGKTENGDLMWSLKYRIVMNEHSIEYAERIINEGKRVGVIIPYDENYESVMKKIQLEGKEDHIKEFISNGEYLVEKSGINKSFNL